MNSIAVKASIDRAKYIVDKYHYGIECNSCKYDYEEYAILDFVDQCFDVCESVDEITNSIVSTTITNCTPVIPTEIPMPVCTPSITVEEL